MIVPIEMTGAVAGTVLMWIGGGYVFYRIRGWFKR